MKVKVAVFGGEDIVNRINKQIEGQDDIIIIPFTYKKTEDTTQLIDTAFMCDIYLFAGALPYLYAKHKIDKKRLPAVQVIFDEYMILTNLYHMKEDYHRQLNRLSIDVLDKGYADNVLKELNIDGKEIYTYSFGNDDHMAIDNIIAHHQRLWVEGKIDYVLTSSDEVEQRLLKVGIPTTSMIIPGINIDKAIEKAKSMSIFNQSKSAQIVAGLVRIKNLHAVKEKQGEFIAQELMLKLHQILLKFSRKTNASVMLDQNNLFVLFGNKAVLDHITNHYRDFPLLREIEATLQVPVDISFGLGLTVKQAEQNAKLALKICAETKGSKCYIVNERQDTIGPLGVKKFFDTSKLYQALIHKARLNNELSYNFIDFITIRNNEPFSSNDIAVYYKVTKRSAERTIHKLLTNEVIRIAGEERPYLKGRPRKLFTLNQ